jgi:hypothetical protein
MMVANTKTQITTNMAMFFLHATLVIEGFVSSTSTRDLMPVSVKVLESVDIELDQNSHGNNALFGHIRP